MASFYVDHDVSQQLARLLQDQGQDTVTARDLGRAAAEDEEHLLWAAQLGRVFVTHNEKHYCLLHRAWLLWLIEWDVTPPRPHAGIAIIPHSRHLPTAAAVEELQRLVMTRGTLADRLWVWRVNLGWLDHC